MNDLSASLARARTALAAQVAKGAALSPRPSVADALELSRASRRSIAEYGYPPSMSWLTHLTPDGLHFVCIQCEADLGFDVPALGQHLDDCPGAGSGGPA